MRFRDIPQLPRAFYEVDVPWDAIESHLDRWSPELNLDPDYQRAHVWTREQQITYVEYMLQGGEVGKNLTFNAPNWNGNDAYKGLELVDGKQRLQAVREFTWDNFPAFGHYYSEFEDPISLTDRMFRFKVCRLQTRAEILQLYLNINAGGTPHTQEELDRVRAMLAKEK